MRNLLWIGDACVSTGFARATHYTLDVLKNSWNVSVLGINYDGDPHSYPYPVYPARGRGGDLFGLSRVPEMIQKTRPDVIVVQNDPWNVPHYLKVTGNVPVVGAIAVDGKNCAGRGLNGLKLAIFWTKFAEDEAKLGGYSGPSAVVPLGVDLDIYKPMPRHEARRALGMPPQFDKAFIFGNVNRNQPRKRLDLCVSYFAEWIKTRGIDDAYLFFHTAPTGEQGYDVSQLAHYYGIARHLILAEPEIGHGDTEARLCETYNCFDAMITTTQGEGFGLPTFEGMACGIPQIVPDWAGLGELCEDAAIKVPCTEIACTPNKINVIGGIADRQGMIEAMDALYSCSHGQLWARCRDRGIALVHQDRYRWPNIGRAFAEALDKALVPVVMKPSTPEPAVEIVRMGDLLAKDYVDV
jgi:D-inositol-3-phosphate glycosyltransferase